MKTLHIIRHAKSRNDLFGIQDFDRPLADRGFADATTMAKRLKAKSTVPDLIISSPALRAITTAKIFAEVLDYPEKKIQLELSIYESFSSDLLQIIHSIPDKFNTTMIFGHNPAFTALFNYLGGTNLDNLPTCGIGTLVVDITTWKDVAPSAIQHSEIDFPKNVF